MLTALLTCTILVQAAATQGAAPVELHVYGDGEVLGVAWPNGVPTVIARHVIADLRRTPDAASGVPAPDAFVLDNARRLLYWLGPDSLTVSDVGDTTGAVVPGGVITLPDAPRAVGRDLAAVPGSSELIVTTDAHVWLFDRDTGLFRLHPRLGDLARVRSVAVHPVHHRIAYVQTNEGESTSSTVRFANPDGELRLEGQRFKVARWRVGGSGGLGPPALPPSGASSVSTRPIDSRAVRIAFGSCADEDDGTARVWRLLGALAPDAVVLLGDTPYIDTTEPRVQAERYRAFASFAPFADLARSTPMYATWDDHDFGSNDSDGTLAGKEHARAAFVAARSMPPFVTDAKEYGTDGEGIHSSFRRGPVEVFLLDTRWFARTAPSDFDASHSTLLGSVQWEWLRTGLLASTAPFKVLACGMIWNGAVRPGKTDHWGAYPAEFAGLCRFLGDAGVSGVVLVGGDIHRSRVVEHDTRATVGYPLTELISSPMHARVIATADATHPGLCFDSGAGHVVCVVGATETTLRATFQTPTEMLRELVLEAKELARKR
jgi:hypothetical protein